MNDLEAKDFLVQQTADQAALDHVEFSALEKRMMYFTESGEMREDLFELNAAFEAEYDSTAYEKKISRLMARAYRRIKEENPEKLRLWKEAFRILSKGDHYILVFWRQIPARKSVRMWPTYVLGALVAAGLWAFMLFFFGSRGGSRRGGPAPADTYIGVPGPLVQHILQALFLFAVVFAIFPQFLYKITSFLKRLVQPTSSAQRRE